MYLYFDINGNLLEIVQASVREGSVKANKIYVFVCPSVDTVTDGIHILPTAYTSAKVNFASLDGTNLNGNGGSSLAMTKLSGSNAVQIPYDKKRDLKFFKYGEKYEMWYIELPASVTATSGVVSASVFLYNVSTQLALNVINFNIESSVVVTPDSTITQSQYSYLYNLISNFNISTFVPYTGATNNVNIGTSYNFIGAGFITTNGSSGLLFDIEHGGISYLSSGGLVETLQLPSPTGSNKTIATQEWANARFTQSGSLAVFSELSVQGEPYGEDNDIPFIDLYASEGAQGIFLGSALDRGETFAEFPDTNTDEVVAYQSWVSNYYAKLSDMTQDILTGTLRIHNSENQNIEYLKVGPSDFAMYVYRNKIVKEVDGADNTFNLPDATDNGGTFNIASREWTATQLPSKRVVGSFNTNGFTYYSQSGFSRIENINLNLNGGFISGTDMLVVTWGNSFALCPMPASYSPGNPIALYGNESENMEPSGTPGEYAVSIFVYSDETDETFTAVPNINKVVVEGYVYSDSNHSNTESFKATGSVINAVVDSNTGRISFQLRFIISLTIADPILDEAIPEIYRNVYEGHVAAAMLSNTGYTKNARVKYILNEDCSKLLEFTLADNFEAPSDSTAYIQCMKLFN